MLLIVGSRFPEANSGLPKNWSMTRVWRHLEADALLKSGLKLRSFSRLVLCSYGGEFVELKALGISTVFRAHVER